jgi:hypothetical protein
MIELVSLAKRGVIKPIVSETFKLDLATEVLSKLKDGKITGVQVGSQLFSFTDGLSTIICLSISSQNYLSMAIVALVFCSFIFINYNLNRIIVNQ